MAACAFSPGTLPQKEWRLLSKDRQQCCAPLHVCTWFNVLSEGVVLLGVMYPSVVSLLMFAALRHPRSSSSSARVEPSNFYFETVECGRRCLLTGALGGECLLPARRELFIGRLI